jgi:hypothetical protein
MRTAKPIEKKDSVYIENRRRFLSSSSFFFAVERLTGLSERPEGAERKERNEENNKKEPRGNGSFCGSIENVKTSGGSRAEMA